MNPGFCRGFEGRKMIKNYKDIIGGIIIFFLIVNLCYASHSTNLKRKTPLQSRKQAGLSKILKSIFQG
jgi:hypothetical protein